MTQQVRRYSGTRPQLVQKRRRLRFAPERSRRVTNLMNENRKILKNGKSRMISIRVSNDEYEAIKAHYGKSNEPCVSDFIRSAVMHSLGFIRPELGPPRLQAELANLNSRIDRLDRRIDRIASLAGIPNE